MFLDRVDSSISNRAKTHGSRSVAIVAFNSARDVRVMAAIERIGETVARLVSRNCAIFTPRTGGVKYIARVRRRASRKVTARSIINVRDVIINDVLSD